jgi:cobaltochelatase CobT
VNSHQPPEQDAGAHRFERALIQVTRALAGEKNLPVFCGVKRADLPAKSLLLPALPMPGGARERARTRGLADRLALRRAHFNEAIHARYRPSGPRARELYDALEDMRCHALGARALTGMARNLEAALVEQLESDVLRRGQLGRHTGMVQAIALLVRERLCGLPPPSEAAALLSRWQGEIETRAGRELDRLAPAASEQARFAIVLHELLRRLDLGLEIGAHAQGERPGESPAPLIAAEVRTPEPGSAGLRIKRQQGELEQDGNLIEAKAPVELAVDGTADSKRSAERASGGARLLHAHPYAELDNPNRNYRVYTRIHDQIVEAERLAEDTELLRLRALLDRESRGLQNAVTRLANRLERLLLSKQRRQWRFDLEEGVLDAARLTRVIIEPLAPLSFKEERDTDFRDTVVSVLLDNSGSMRGRPIMLAALCADVLARTLERCGVKVEILGFTTRAWKGGAARAEWVQGGAKPAPGRLGELLHIIYKSADAPWRHARRNLGLMLREELLKENIDGESLLWAHDRLERRSESRRILMVISDGVPLDEATLSANPGSYLEQHLRNVIHWIEKRSAIELLAIGIGHDVSDFYQRALTIADAGQLGAAMTTQLAALLTQQSTKIVPARALPARRRRRA